LARPTSLAAPWRRAKVVSASADSIQISNIDGDHRSLRPADVVPLGR
jgi:glutamate formiminotransferase